MIPTNYLRYVKFWVTHNMGQAEQHTVQLRKLQVWWYDASADAKAHGTTRVSNKRNDIEPKHGFGEWRDVETVEEA